MQLRYQLQGVDAGWVDAGRGRELTLSGPAPGSYDFLVEASNVQGQFVGQPTVLHLDGLARLLPELAIPRRCCCWCRWRSPSPSSGCRVYRHQVRKKELDRRIAEATAAIEILSGMLPICSSCHKVRDDGGYWEQVESYLSSHTEAQFTHGLCPDCCAKVLSELDDSKQGLPAA